MEWESLVLYWSVKLGARIHCDLSVKQFYIPFQNYTLLLFFLLIPINHLQPIDTFLYNFQKKSSFYCPLCTYTYPFLIIILVWNTAPSPQPFSTWPDLRSYSGNWKQTVGLWLITEIVLSSKYQLYMFSNLLCSLKLKMWICVLSLY